MGWKWCEDPPPGYWVCGEPEDELCVGESPGLLDQPVTFSQKPDKWNPAGAVTLEDGQVYYMKCSPKKGCEAKVETDPAVNPPWKIVGAIGVPTAQVPAGTYEVYCRTGGGSACQIALVVPE